MKRGNRNGRTRNGERKALQPASTAKDNHEATPRAVARAQYVAPRFIVGLGASAGGLEAFQTFFANMPPDSGMAFVLVQHLDPYHKSLLVELLSKHTKMKVVTAEDGMPAMPNSVFIIPPDATLTIADGTLAVLKPAPDRKHRRPIDTFLISLAEDQGENAVCIILSGGGSDGSQGLVAVKEHGGLTLAQAQVDELAMSGMPSSAANTGLVDYVMPVEAMPAKLIEYQRHFAEADLRKGPDGIRQDTAEHLKDIAGLLRHGLGHDFSRYKENTLLRRIQRRMQVLQIGTVPDYVDLLRKEPLQLELLFRELLIGVTHFFRDTAAFEALEATIIPKILEARGSDDQIRVWVAGCATGEEVYSIAILLREAIAKRKLSPKVVIFGTDIDDRAIAIARAGRYRTPLLSELSPERIHRWFVQDGNHFCPIKEIRETCIFSVHSVIKDPPFSRLDLISCRNLLIYLEAPLQDRIFPIFHYALRPGGFLFLGSSESIGRRAELFSAIDKKHRIFRRREEITPSLPNFSVAGAKDRAGLPMKTTRARPANEEGVDVRIRGVMEAYSPAYVVIDRSNHVVRFSGRTGKYLEPSSGAASLNLFGMLQKGLRPVVRAALKEAITTRARVDRENVPIEVDRKGQLINIVVEPVPDEARADDPDLHVVAFHDLGPVVGIADPKARAAAHAESVPLQDVELELLATRTHLQQAIDEAERANEDLKSSNEEYQSVNEELQSTNEELETSKEEMQSINEELQTVNSELNSKNDALTRVNSDLQNILESTQIAILFLDEGLRIRSFTPAIKDVFHLQDSDRGRKITDFASQLGYDRMRQDVEKVLRNLSPVEHEIQGPNDGLTYIVRIRPYRTVNKILEGVVITFTDISERKHNEQDHARLAAIVDSSQDAIIGHSLNGFITSWNSEAERIFGYAAAEAIGKPLSILMARSQVDEVPSVLEKLKRGERVEHFEIGRVRKGGKPIDVSITISPVKNASGEMIAASTIARDLTERGMAEQHRLLLMAELDHRVKNTLATVQSIARQTIQSAQSFEEFGAAFDARMVALSQTHNLLMQSRWEGAALHDVVLGELSPFYNDQKPRFTIAGGKIELRPRVALALGMAIHELAANAAKYGALSGTSGHIDVAWEVRDNGAGRRLDLSWTESGGPPVVPPQRRGFGSRLIERGLKHELQGEVELEFDPRGVRCIIQIGLDPEGEVT